MRTSTKKFNKKYKWSADKADKINFESLSNYDTPVRMPNNKISIDQDDAEQ